MNPSPQDFLSQISDLSAMLDALQRVPGAMFMIKNRESRYIYMSQALRKVCHIKSSYEIVGKTDYDLFPKLIAENFRQNDQQVFKHGRPLINEVHLSGIFAHAMKWAYSSKFPLRDRKGKVIGLIAINELYDQVMGENAELNRLLPAIQHVMKHHTERITIAQLARLCGWSESQFTRVFKQRMKLPAYAFVEQVRMHHVLEAVQHSSRSIADIALDSGFYDASAFVKRFKKFTGTTPLNFRRQFQHSLTPEQAMALPKVR